MMSNDANSRLNNQQSKNAYSGGMSYTNGFNKRGIATGKSVNNDMNSKSANNKSFVPGSQQTDRNGASPSENQIIDLESEDLTYYQARSIRLQVQKDVDLLKNRVRMLEIEEQRALKKIEETKQKTKTLLQLRDKNNKKYLEKLKEQEKERQLHAVTDEKKERRMKARNDLQ